MRLLKAHTFGSDRAPYARRRIHNEDSTDGGADVGTSTRSLLLGIGVLTLALLTLPHVWMLTLMATGGWPLHGGMGGMMSQWGMTMRPGVIGTSPWIWLVWAAPLALTLLGALLLARATLTGTPSGRGHEGVPDRNGKR